MATTITHKDKNDETSPAMFGGHQLLEYASHVNFSEFVFESLTGKAPSRSEIKIFDLILNLCFDHGPNSPSASATTAAAKTGKGMGEAVGEGVAQIGDSHGGAGEPLMRILYDLHAGKTNVVEVVEHYKKEGKRMPGFGHRVYKDIDPRAELILQSAQESDVGRDFIDALTVLHLELNTKLGKSLPINIDGAIAAVLCGLRVEPAVGRAVFIIARSAGLCAHFLQTSATVA